MKTNVFSLLVSLIVFISFGIAASVDAASYTSDSAYNPYYYSGNTYYQTPSYTTYYYNTQYTNQYREQQLVYLYAQLQMLQEQLRQLRYTSGSYYDYAYYDNYRMGYGVVDVTTRTAQNVDDESATLRGTVDLNGEDDARVYFEYGTKRNYLDDTSRGLSLDDTDSENFSIRVRNLSDDETYYFRAVAEDASGDTSYGATKSFTTDRDGNSNNDEPNATTDSVRSVTASSAGLRGSVAMNDFRNGHVFFVYGEDRNQVRDIESEYTTYADIDEDGDNLQKQSVDSDLDTQSDYQLTVRSLNNNTDYYAALCVEYLDDNDDDTIVCGDTESFTTD